MKRGGRLRTRKPLRAVSPKRAARKEERDECRRIVFERCEGACEACPRLHDGPVRRAVEVHEIKTRGRGGSIYDPDNAVGLCRLCHNWIHDHPDDALALGLLAHSWDAA